jgi:hypothetical protein
MIARARAPSRFGDVGPARQWQMRLPAVNARSARTVRGAQLPYIYKSGEREGEPFTSTLSACSPLPSLHSAARPFVPSSARFVPVHRRQPPWLARSQSRCWIRCRGAAQR